MTSISDATDCATSFKYYYYSTVVLLWWSYSSTTSTGSYYNQYYSIINPCIFSTSCSITCTTRGGQDRTSLPMLRRECLWKRGNNRNRHVLVCL
uniref:Uncharacterized protein n=1 Tax=Physcomitrium patens TaxID=3218 RepID=A0A2K1JM38_PHYPA|nr:hypothetical protein PHYPA_017431 [Physcomitrium patens]